MMRRSVDTPRGGPINPHFRLIRAIGVIVPRRIRADWRQEWDAELRYREAQLARWHHLNLRAKVDLFWRSLGAFLDALWLQQLRWEDDMLQDLRYGVRLLLTRPGFTLLAVAALAVGIGPITAIFSLVNGLLLRPLPYSEPDRLVSIWRTNPERNWHEYPLSIPNFLDHQQRNQTLASASAFASGAQSLGGDGEPETVERTRVSAEFFTTLGATLELGRGFVAGEDLPGAAKVVVLSHGLWSSRFGADPSAVGRDLLLDGQPYQIVGVLAPKSEFPSTAQLWIPMMMDPVQNGRGGNFLNVIGRLQPGVSIEQAGAQWNSVAEQLEAEYPEFNGGGRIELIPLKAQLVARVRQPLLILFAAIGVVLLIACGNVANLLLARANSRQRELAIRAALGASPMRLVRQLLTESLLLAFMGGVAGTLIAGATRDLLLSLNPIRIPRSYDGGIDLSVLAFTAGVVLLTGIIFGLIPAFEVTRCRISSTIKEAAGPGHSGSTRKRLRSTLVVAEVALSLVMLIGAGLLIRSFLSLSAVNPGFNPERVLALNVSLPVTYNDPGRRIEFVRQAQEKLEAIPGAGAVASAAYVPMADMRTSRRFAIDGRPAPERGKEPLAVEMQVGPGYFGLLEIPVRAGRDFNGRESAENPQLIINESFAERFFPGEDAIGKRLRFYAGSAQAQPPPWIEIIGVVSNISQFGPANEPEPTIYTAQLARPWSFMSFLVKTDGDPEALSSSVRTAIASVDRNLAVSRVSSLEDVMALNVADRRGLMALIAAFAGVALLLAMVGIYGVLSYLVVQRAHEIGVRMAIGAKRADVIRLVIGEGLKLTLIGVGIGLGVGLGADFLLAGLLKGQLFRVAARDPLTFVGVPLILISVALVAAYVPARRASAVDPVRALRAE
jgi:putative ABC transport system permease protein